MFQQKHSVALETKILCRIMSISHLESHLEHTVVRKDNRLLNQSKCKFCSLLKALLSHSIKPQENSKLKESIIIEVKDT